MGKGKGSVQFWVCPIKQGQMLFEISGNIPSESVKEILKDAKNKLSVKCKIAARSNFGP
jgi:large subunit ribosomal protein L16